MSAQDLHAPASPEGRARVTALLTLAASVIGLATRTPLFRVRGPAGATVVLAGRDRAARFLAPDRGATVVMDGRSFVVAVLRRASAVAAAREACADCGAALEAEHALAAARGDAFVVHVDVAALGTVSCVVSLDRGGAS